MSLTLKTLFGFFIRCPHGNVHLMSVSVPGGGGRYYVILYIRRLGPFLGLKILNFNIYFFFIFFWGGGGVGGFRKMNIFGGYEEYFLGACNS